MIAAWSPRPASMFRSTQLSVKFSSPSGNQRGHCTPREESRTRVYGRVNRTPRSRTTASQYHSGSPTEPRVRRVMSRSTRGAGVMLVVLSSLATGCATFRQASDKAFIREPGDRMYRPPADVSESAKALWEYAVLSENAYHGEWKKQRPAPPEQEAQVLQLPEATPEAYAR